MEASFPLRSESFPLRGTPLHSETSRFFEKQSGQGVTVVLSRRGKICATGSPSTPFGSVLNSRETHGARFLRRNTCACGKRAYRTAERRCRILLFSCSRLLRPNTGEASLKAARNCACTCSFSQNSKWPQLSRNHDEMDDVAFHPVEARRGQPSSLQDADLFPSKETQWSPSRVSGNSSTGLHLGTSQSERIRSVPQGQNPGQERAHGVHSKDADLESTAGNSVWSLRRETTNLQANQPQPIPPREHRSGGGSNQKRAVTVRNKIQHSNSRGSEGGAEVVRLNSMPGWLEEEICEEGGELMLPAPNLFRQGQEYLQLQQDAREGMVLGVGEDERHTQGVRQRLLTEHHGHWRAEQLRPSITANQDKEWQVEEKEFLHGTNVHSLSPCSELQEHHLETNWHSADNIAREWLTTPTAPHPTRAPSAGPVSTPQPKPTLFPLPPEALRALVPISGSGVQVLQCLGGPLDWLRRFVLSMAAAVLLYNVSPLFTVAATSYWAWAPLWAAALGNMALRLKYPFAGLWLGRLASLRQLDGSSGQPQWDLFIVDRAGVSIHVVADAPSVPARLAVGEPVQMLAVSDSSSFARFKLLREAFLPRHGLWLAQDASIERQLFESLQLRLVPAVLNKLPSEDEEDWDSLFSLLCEETSETLRQYKYEDSYGKQTDGEGLSVSTDKNTWTVEFRDSYFDEAHNAMLGDRDFLGSTSGRPTPERSFTWDSLVSEAHGPSAEYDLPFHVFREGEDVKTDN